MRLHNQPGHSCKIYLFLFSALLDALIDRIDKIDEKQDEILRLLRSLSAEKGATNSVEDIFDKPASSVVELRRLEEKIRDKNLKRKMVNGDRLVILKNQIWDNDKELKLLWFLSKLATRVVILEILIFYMHQFSFWAKQQPLYLILKSELWMTPSRQLSWRGKSQKGAMDIFSLFCQATRSGADHDTLILFFTFLRKKINSIQFKILYCLLYKYVSSRTNTIK